jgi:hypothetical protein
MHEFFAVFVFVTMVIAPGLAALAGKLHDAR